MKTKNTIQIVETPIIDKYDFHENNGIINPAFADAHPDVEEDTSSSRALVDSDYRQCFKPKNTPHSTVQYPTDELIIEHRPNGSSLASSWVYEFNNPSPSTTRNNMTSSTTSLNGIYRPAYGVGYNEHMSYEMDLNQDHRKNSKQRQGCVGQCWPTLVRLFVWSVIVVCLLGVFISVAFIIYIERFAATSDQVLNSTSNQDRSTGNTTTLRVDYNSISTSAPVVLTSMRSNPQTIQTSLPKPTTVPPKVTTDSDLDTTGDNFTVDLQPTQNPLVIDGQNQSQELNVTEVSALTPETTKSVSAQAMTTPSTLRLPTTGATTSTPTPSTRRMSTKSTAPTYQTAEQTRKSSLDSRVLTIDYRKTTEPDINSTEKSDQVIGHKSEDNLQTTSTSSPVESSTGHPKEATANGFDIIEEIVGEIENSTELRPKNMIATTVLSESQTRSTRESDYTQTNYNKAEQAINQQQSWTSGDSSQNESTTTLSSLAMTTIITTTQHEE